MLHHLVFNVFCIFLMMLPGFIAVKKGYFSRVTTTELSNILVKFFYPSFIFYAIVQSFTFKELVSSWTLPVCCFGFMFFGYIIGFLSLRFINFKSKDEKTGFLFQCTLNNYSFLPLPLVLFLYGEKGAAALIFSSFGAEVALWTLGVFILQGQKLSIKNLSHLLSTPLISLYLAVAVLLLFELAGIDGKKLLTGGIGHYSIKYIFETLNTIGLATVPVAMIVAGARIASIDFSGLANARVWILSIMRLIVIPVLGILIIKLLPLPQITEQIMIVVAVMPVALSSIILSEIYCEDNNFIALTVLSTHLLSLVSVPFIITLASRYQIFN